MIEVITHLAVIAFILGDCVWHLWKWYSRRRNPQQLYTLDQAKVVLFETVALADPETFALPKGLKHVQ